MEGATHEYRIALCHIVMTCHFLQSGPSSDRSQSPYLQFTSLQHHSILAVADSRSIHLQSVSQMLHPAGISHGVLHHFQNVTFKALHCLKYSLFGDKRAQLHTLL